MGFTLNPISNFKHILDMVHPQHTQAPPLNYPQGATISQLVGNQLQGTGNNYQGKLGVDLGGPRMGQRIPAAHRYNRGGVIFAPQGQYLDPYSSMNFNAVPLNTGYYNDEYKPLPLYTGGPQ